MRISYTRCATYQHCPHQYKLQYVDRIPVPEAIQLVFGSAVHRALSFMYDPRHLRMPSREQVIDVFAKAWKEVQLQDSEDQRQGYFEQGVLLLGRFHDRHSEREEGRYTAATELFFSIPFDGEHTLTGRIDRVDLLPNNRLEVVDYKTGRRMPPQSIIEKDAQLAIYRMAADLLYPNREVTTTLLYVFHDYEMRLTQSAEFLAQKQDEIRDVIAGIEVGDFDPRPGPHCDWCSYRAHCTLYRTPVVPPDLAEVNIGALLREYAELDAQEKRVEDRLGQLKQEIRAYLDGCQVERVEGGGYVAERRHSRRITGWDEARLRDLLLPIGLWGKVTQVSSSAMRELLRSAKLTRDQRRELEGAATYAETEQIRVKRAALPEDEEMQE